MYVYMYVITETVLVIFDQYKYFVIDIRNFQPAVLQQLASVYHCCFIQNPR